MQATFVTASTAIATAVRVEVIRSASEWDGLGPRWEALFQSSPTASPPLRFEWLRQWWRIYGATYGAGAEALRVMTVWREKRLIGALPLYEMRPPRLSLGLRRLAFVSTGEAESEETCPDYLDLLHAPGEQTTCLEALRQALVDCQQTWDQLDLKDIADTSPLLAWDQTRAWGMRLSVSLRGACPIARIAGGLEEYLQRISVSNRQQYRRLLRSVERSGATFELANGQQVEPFFSDLVRLHQTRWVAVGQPGCFAASRFTQFHRQLAGLWVPSGKAVLARLSLDGKPLAAVYGFVVGRKFDYYQSGVALRGSETLKSPGTSALLLLIRALAEQGIEEFDFLRGPSTYKHRLATCQRPLVRLRIARPTLRMASFALSSVAGRAWNKARRRMQGGAGSAPELSPPLV